MNSARTNLLIPTNWNTPCICNKATHIFSEKMYFSFTNLMMFSQWAEVFSSQPAVGFSQLTPENVVWPIWCGGNLMYSSPYDRSQPMTYIWQGSRMRLGFTARVGQIWKWSNGVKISEMGIFWCISITNNVEPCKKINEKAQTTNFSVLAKGRQLRKELFAENMKN